MEQVILNFYPIAKFTIILFAIVGAYSTINNFMHLLARFGKDKLDNKKDIHAKDCDTDITQDLIQSLHSRYPDVEQNFIIKPEREQNVENNQEIHEINKKLVVIQKDLDEIRRIQNGGL